MSEPWLGIFLVHPGFACGNPDNVCDGVYAWADGTHVDVGAYEGNDELGFVADEVGSIECGVLRPDGVVEDKYCYESRPFICQWRCENVRKGACHFAIHKYNQSKCFDHII